MTLIFYNDRSVPKNMSAFFRLDYVRQIVKCRVKAKKGQMIDAGKQREIMQALHEIAKRHDYNWESLLSEARRKNG